MMSNSDHLTASRGRSHPSALRASCLVAFLTLCSFGRAQEDPSPDPFPLVEGTARITGRIANYRGVYQTGTLSVFDGITRLSRETEFAIDDQGRFQIEERVGHASHGTAVLDLEGVYHPLFLEPGEDLVLEFGADGVRFLGASGGLNRELADYVRASSVALADSAASIEGVHASDRSAEEALAVYRQHADRRRAHLEGYAREHALSSRARRILEQDIDGELAHASICFRYRSVGGRVRSRPGLPESFVHDLLERHPITAFGTPVSRPAVDYLANVVQVLEKPEEESLDARLAYYASQEVFTDEELALLRAAFEGDREKLSSAAFQAFDTAENRAKEFELRKRYRVDTLLRRVQRFPASTGRDLVVSQGVARHYLSGDLIEPTAAEWERIEDVIGSAAVVARLRREVAARRTVDPADAEEVARPTSNDATGQVDRFLQAHRGKVIYIDFWATWCAPCRAEIPDAKRLARRFASEDVVFLNLCARSSREDWTRMVRQKELGGTQLFLGDAEYEELAKRFGVRGFPTYVLIGKDGTISERNAPRPSSGDEIESRIRSLLR